MITVRVAQPADDAIVRSLLRENAMPSWVEITLEREPSFFAGSECAGHEWAVLGDDAGQTVGMYTAAMRPTHVNGREEQLGYLGGMRVDRRFRHRIRYLRIGYASIRRLAPRTGTLPWWFTVIAEGNAPARRLLEAGVAGLPAYVKCGAYATSVLAASRGRPLGLWRPARPGESARISAFHNRQAARVQFSPVLDDDTVEAVGLGNFLVCERDGQMHAVVALWNQQDFKQVVVRGYRRPLGVLRPAYNLYARLFRRCLLPRAGEALAQTFLAFFARDADAPPATSLFVDALSHCGTPAAVIGHEAEGALAQDLAPLRPIRYASAVYSVTFDAAARLDGRPVRPEAALL